MAFQLINNTKLEFTNALLRLNTFHEQLVKVTGILTELTVLVKVGIENVITDSGTPR